MLKHVVFFKFKDGVGEDEIVGLEKSFAALPPVIPEILSYEFGRDVVRSERSCDLALFLHSRILNPCNATKNTPLTRLCQKRLTSYVSPSWR